MMHRVGMADAKAAEGTDSLLTLGLGSCVGVALYDAKSKIAGLAHIMLPAYNGRGTPAPAKFADTGIPHLLAIMHNLGAERKRICAKLAGGAQMFATHSVSDSIRVGPRNIEAVTHTLEELGIPVIATAVGGNFGRTIELFCEDGRVSVRSAQAAEMYI